MRKNNKRNVDKKKSTIKIFVVIILTALIGYICSYGAVVGTGAYQYKIKPLGDVLNKGLDLVGGVSVLDQIEGETPDANTIKRTIELLNLRLNKYGVSETTVVQEGKDKIRIEVPGKFDPNDVVKNIGSTGKLTFKGPNGEELLTGEDVKKATAGTNPDTGKPEVSLELNDSGTQKFADATTKYVGQNISINMDEEQLTNPQVKEAITTGKATISGSTTLEEATKLANLINAGALPVILKAVEVKTVGSTLGMSALPNSLKAGIIGVSLVCLFMFALYRRPGLLADISLIIYIILVLAVFISIKSTLTLAGIAGFLLTVGMALDANVLIFERVKEELRKGKSIKFAVDSGFKKALSSVIDSNSTTIIGGLVLYFVGTGAVKGFALTLVVGIIVSLFTALTITQNLLKWSVSAGFISKLSHFGVKEEKNV